MIDFPASPTVGDQFTSGGTVWEWDGVKWTIVPGAASGGPFLELAGGTMVGDLTLAADPLNPLDAATKEYVDTLQTGFLPLSGGTLSGALTLGAGSGLRAGSSGGGIIVPGANLFQIAGANGTSKNLISTVGGLTRWDLRLGDNTNESGANAGSNFSIQNYNDAGAQIGFFPVFTINRATGMVSAPALTSQALTAPQAVLPNRIDNGDMSIDQHNGGVANPVPVTPGWLYCPDRFYGVNIQATSRFTMGQNLAAITTKAAGFAYFLGVQSTSAYTSAAAAQLYVAHTIEADAVADLGWGASGAQPITVSFWARSSLTGNFSFALSSSNPTVAGGTTYRYYVTTYSLPNANTWTKITLTIPGEAALPLAWPIGNGPGLVLIWDLGSGTNAQTPITNNWQGGPAGGIAIAVSGAVHVTGTNNATWGLTGVKLEAGSLATPFPVEDLTTRWARCQRQYQILNAVIACTGYSDGVMYNSYELATLMRAAPTVTPVGVAFNNAVSWALNNAFPDNVTMGLTLAAAGFAYAQGTLIMSAEF